MRLGACEELEHLNALQGQHGEEAGLIQELGRRLEALRCYDQYFCDSDWHPRAQRGGQWSGGEGLAKSKRR
jgi:hypothetical protein